MVGSSVWPDRGGHLWAKDRQVERADGTVVRYAVRGPVGAPPVVCCAGYLCPDNFWRTIGPDLATDHRVVILNYRGVGASSEAYGEAYPPTAEAYRLPLLAGDVAAVMDVEGHRSATVIGHSMGVQVALALWEQRPDLVGRLALVAGSATSPFETFYGTSIAAKLFPFISTTVPALPRDLSGVALRALELPVTMPVARAIRALGPHTPDEGMRPYRWHLGRIDPRTAIWTARGMHEYSATPFLGDLDVPVFVAIGGEDAWTPPRVGRELAEAVGTSDLLLIPGGSHALPIEFPGLLLPRIRALTPGTAAAAQ
jgi:pimeloyl-ACP methyl ester carboxylesterase